jgi:lipopolysaccharide biosynthesis protein
MNLKELLAKHKILKQAELARQMFEGKPSANTRLANKLSGVNYQKILPEDEESAFKSLKELSDDIIEFGKTIPKSK